MDACVHLVEFVMARNLADDVSPCSSAHTITANALFLLQAPHLNLWADRDVYSTTLQTLQQLPPSHVGSLTPTASNKRTCLLRQHFGANCSSPQRLGGQVGRNKIIKNLPKIGLAASMLHQCSANVPIPLLQVGSRKHEHKVSVAKEGVSSIPVRVDKFIYAAFANNHDQL